MIQKCNARSILSRMNTNTSNEENYWDMECSLKSSKDNTLDLMQPTNNFNSIESNIISGNDENVNVSNILIGQNNSSVSDKQHLNTQDDVIMNEVTSENTEEVDILSNLSDTQNNSPKMVSQCGLSPFAKEFIPSRINKSRYNLRSINFHNNPNLNLQRGGGS